MIFLCSFVAAAIALPVGFVLGAAMRVAKAADLRMEQDEAKAVRTSDADAERERVTSEVAD